jgi:hypothetical protein
MFILGTYLECSLNTNKISTLTVVGFLLFLLVRGDTHLNEVSKDVTLLPERMKILVNEIKHEITIFLNLLFR